MNYNKKTIEDIDLAGKKVLVRCDFNVPLKDGVITSDKRIVEALPTIKYLLGKGCKVILCSHMGKPHNVLTEGFGLTKKEKKKVEALPVEEQAAAKAELLAKAGKDRTKLSLKPVADRLNEYLDGKVAFATDIIGEDAKAKIAAMNAGEAVLIENVRFDAREEKNDAEFAKELASLAEVYVNDAFGTAHRAHATTAGVADYLPAVCGYLIQKEIGVMGKALENPARPFVAILGGAKVSDKLNVINNLLTKVDTLIIGGGMAYTFLAAKGYSIGTSLFDAEKVDYCKEMMAKAEEAGVKLLLPIDTVIAADFPNPIDAEIAVETVSSDAIPADKMGLDIGENTRALFADAVKSAKTVVWNGPMGVFENPTLAKGTIAVAEALAESEAITIVGGGDSAAACEQLGFADRITHISTGGGASLEFLEGKELPGIACLLDK
ncbi:MAG: phosphoglycerate kinase [Clostridia bacterium]|nr:phosphoglycerate kinase [Clostridia bacterium]MBQ8420128.1 phosphoglycerate kinase [Clostridia bacterium]